MSSTRSEAADRVADRVATKLLGRYYVGQKVKLAYDFDKGNNKEMQIGFIAIVSKYDEKNNDLWIENDPISSTSWDPSYWEPA